MASAPEPSQPQDELKRKFREALERKRGRGADKAVGDDAAGAPGPQHAHGPAKAQRTFRRRSGSS
jgi:hypothetical protein